MTRKKQIGIAVIAYNRPRYLYVTLESLFRVAGIDAIQVAVYVDGGQSAEHVDAMRSICSDFPLARTVMRDTLVNGIWNLMDGLVDRFASGADEVIYLEDDFIIQPDALEYIINAEEQCFFRSLSRGSDEHVYNPMGNSITAENFALLRSWVYKREYYGMRRPLYTQIMGEQTASSDCVFFAFLLHYGLKVGWAPDSYIAHFGLVGKNYANPLEEDLEIEAAMFAGAPKSWLGNITSILERGQFPERLGHRLFPRGFKYRGYSK